MIKDNSSSMNKHVKHVFQWEESMVKNSGS